jgi:hypothetical protein
MGRFLAGLSIGQPLELSGLVIVEQGQIPDPGRPDYQIPCFDVREIRRWESGTKYPELVAGLGKIYSDQRLRDSVLLVDGTGVGKAVTDYVRRSGLLAAVRVLSITAGVKDGDGTVPKVNLVSATVTASQQRQIRYADGLRLAPILEKELETFTATVSAERNETYPSWRDNEHDDLVFALALSVWFGSKAGAVRVGPEPMSRSDRLAELARIREDLRMGFEPGGLPPDTFGTDEMSDSVFG